MTQNVKRMVKNPLVKAAGEVCTFEDWQIEELLKCHSDPVYFANTYAKAITLDHGLTDIKFSRLPLMLLDDVEPQITLELLSSSIFFLFHSKTPCCIHKGRFS